MKYLFSLLLLLTVIPGALWAQEKDVVYRAKVERVVEQFSEILPGTSKESHKQVLEITLLSGPNEGNRVQIQQDAATLEVGDEVYVQPGEVEGTYIVRDTYRWNGIISLFVFFIIVVSIFAGWQGIRSVLSLIVSFAMIGLILVPGLLKGYSPILLCAVVAVVILTAAIYITHGFKRTASIALGATTIAVCITFFFAWLAVKITHLTGYASDSAVYLNFASTVQLDFVGLLLGAIVIGVLGVLDDISITQVALVEELKAQAPRATLGDLYKSAMRVGREHVAALVNTLSLAYLGSALPLVLLFATSTYPTTFLLNNEMFVTEMVRIVIGSIGLIITVPLATLGAIWFAKPGEGNHIQHHH